MRLLRGTQQPPARLPIIFLGSVGQAASSSRCSQAVPVGGCPGTGRQVAPAVMCRLHHGSMLPWTGQSPQSVLPYCTLFKSAQGNRSQDITDSMPEHRPGIPERAPEIWGTAGPSVLARYCPRPLHRPRHALAITPHGMHVPSPPAMLHRAGSPVPAERPAAACKPLPLLSLQPPGIWGNPLPTDIRAQGSAREADAWMGSETVGQQETEKQKEIGLEWPWKRIRESRSSTARWGAYRAGTGQAGSEGLPCWPSCRSRGMQRAPEMQSLSTAFPSCCRCSSWQRSPSSSTMPTPVCQPRCWDRRCQDHTSWHLQQSPQCSVSRSPRPLGVLWQLLWASGGL